MKTYYVGGKHFFDRFSNLEAAVERADNDDVIELHKDVEDVEVYVTKNITINGNGHVIRPKAGKAAFDCVSFITMNDVRFECMPRTNAVIIRGGGSLTKIVTRIAGPARAIYPTIVQRSGTLTITESSIMQMETYESHGTMPATVTFFKNSKLVDYYGGYAYLDDHDYNLSKFRGMSSFMDSDIMCALLAGKCKLSDTVLRNFNKAVGTVELTSCRLQAERGEIVKCQDEPIDGPLKDLNTKVIPYALHIAGGKVTAENFSSNMTRDCIGFYMTSGSLDIRSTTGDNDQSRHLMADGAVVFNDVTDNGFYEIKKARCGIIRSQVNTSKETKSAMEQLDDMIGLQTVKKQLRTIMNTISMNMKCPEKNFGFTNHMVFAGDPGTGKTTVAKLVAQALFEIGAIPENKCMEVPASQLIKGFVGQTGEHVEAVMKQALGGVLFIDEAYELMVKDGQNTFNNDALAVLLRYMEDHRHDLVVIAAGYEKEMREFLASNVGLTRRFQWVSFTDYTPEEMTSICMSMCASCKEDFAFMNPEDALVSAFRGLTKFYLSHPDMKGRTTNGGNGGLVRNLFQQIAFARNNRVAENQGRTAPLSKTTMKFTKDDIMAGYKEELKKAMNVTFGAPVK